MFELRGLSVMFMDKPIKLPNSLIMYETDIFVKFRFHFIGIQIVMTKDSQIVITLSHTKMTQTYTQNIETNFLT
jgi:hypothetical protein